jgi:O-antigen/teichoic acid export membrane protein
VSVEATRVIKNTWILYARMAITVFISLYSTRLVLKELGTEDFGIFNLVGGTIAMLSFLNAAMAAATQRFMSYAEGAGQFEKQVQIFNVSTVLHILAAILVFIVLEIGGIALFDHFLNIPPERLMTAKLVWQFMIVSTLLTIVSVPYDAVINAHENMLFFAILGIIEALFKVGVALYLIITPFDKLTTFGFLTALSGIVLLLIRRIYCHLKYKECVLSFKKYFSKPVFKEMAAFAGWSFLGSASSIIANYGQIIILNIFFGAVVNAAQSVAIQLTAQLSIFANTMLKALYPLITKSEGTGNRSLMLKASILGSKYSYFLLIFFFIPFFIEMPFIFKIWLKSTPEFAVLFCRLGLLRSLVEQVFITLSSTIQAVGNIREYQIFSSVLNIFPLIVSYSLFSFHYEAPIIYVVYILYAIINGLVTLYFARKYCDLSIQLFFDDIIVRCIKLTIIIFIIAIIPNLLIRNEGYLRLALTFILSTISFCTLFFRVGLSSNERKDFKIVIYKLLRMILKIFQQF